VGVELYIFVNSIRSKLRISRSQWCERELTDPSHLL